MSILRETIKTATRSGGWRKVRKQHLLENNTCICCGKVKGLEVHHIEPFHINPELELDPKNLVTLCRKHHFTFGHLEYWKSYNVAVKELSASFYNLYKERP